MASQGKLLAFADDLFFIMDSQEEAEKALAACDRIDIAGLHINRTKTQIITDQVEMKDVKEICGIQISDELKYLGLILSCDRVKLLKNMKQKL